MFVDENGAYIITMLIIALIVALFFLIGFCIGLRAELKESERECKSLRQYIRNTCVDEELSEAGHEEYRRQFERQMRCNAAEGKSNDRG